jgi:dTDP-4-dehydrorhamnose reductase
MLATAVVPALETAGHEVLELARSDADVTKAGALTHSLKMFQPDWVFHLAAFTRVDDCESQPDRAYAVNTLGARNTALAAAGCGAALLLVSTDYVFDGRATRPYREYDAAGPQSIYAASKWAGEQAVREAHARHLIVRTAWLFGRGGHNFVDTIHRKARAGEPLKVVDDQRGSPTWTQDLAQAMVRLAALNAFGTYHVTNSGDCTWWELAHYLVGRAGLALPVERTSTADLARPAARPAYSVLSNHLYECVTSERMPHWQDATDRYLKSRSSSD